MFTFRRAELYKRLARCVSYVQGQSPSPRTREYFYYIDHQGQLFLDDAKLKNFITCFKDKKFLAFFFKRVKRNMTGRYESAFPYVSPCGREMNYIHCDDLPIVFTHLLDGDDRVILDVPQHACSSSPQGAERLSYGGAGELLSVPFDPSKLCMLSDTGRVYYGGGLEKLGGVGLVKSSLAIELSRFFQYGPDTDDHSPPVAFSWQGRTLQLDESTLSKLHCSRS